MSYDDILRIALGFVLEAETWPVFMAWCKKYANTDACREWLASQPDINDVRGMYVDHLKG